MTTAKEKKANGAGGIVDSTVGLGAAATKFAIDQVETVLCAVASPGRAMDRVKRSIDNFADAMNAPIEQAREAAKEVTAKAVETVRKPEPEPKATDEADEEVETPPAFNGRKT